MIKLWEGTSSWTGHVMKFMWWERVRPSTPSATSAVTRLSWSATLISMTQMMCSLDLSSRSSLPHRIRTHIEVVFREIKSFHFISLQSERGKFEFKLSFTGYCYWTIRLLTDKSFQFPHVTWRMDSQRKLNLYGDLFFFFEHTSLSLSLSLFMAFLVVIFGYREGLIFPYKFVSLKE